MTHRTRIPPALAAVLLIAVTACAGGSDTPDADVTSAPTTPPSPTTTTPTTTVGSTPATTLPIPTLPGTTPPSTAPPSTTPTVTTPPTSASPPTTNTPANDLATTVQEFVGNQSGGAIALVRRDGTINIEAAGAADADGTPLRADHQMRVGSISKPFVAVLVLQLVDEQLVALDEPLGTYVPDALIGADVTIAELLSHQSGIPNYTAQPGLFATAFSDLTRTFTPNEMIEFVVDVEPGPRGSFAYSNTNYLLLGQLVEAVDGGDLGASLERRITGPLGLTRTWFDTPDRPPADDLAGGWSAGVIAGDPEAPYTSVSSGAWAAGALISTVEDLATFLDALLAGDLLSEASFRAMTDTGRHGYGFGISVARLGAGGDGWAHSGAIPGYHATMGITTDGADLLVIATNSDLLVADELAVRILSQP